MPCLAIRWTSTILVFTAASAGAQAPPPRARPAAGAFAAMQTLDAELLASRSATATLERWCGDHHLADPPRIRADAVADARKPPTSAQVRRLAVASAREIKYRHVRLRCGAHVLSEADNWYVPARLTAEMNRLLETTDTPFGLAVAALEPSRETFNAKLRWIDSGSPMPPSLFEHHAILYTRDRQPFSEVAEVYTRDLLAAPETTSDATDRDVRAARIAQNEAIAAGDVERAASFWTDDVTVRRALGQSVAGKAAARRALEPPAPPAPRIVYQRTTSSVDVAAEWPLAFETGTWAGHLDAVSGPAIIGGRFSAQWVKRGDRWLIRSEVFVALTCAGAGCRSEAVP